MPGVAFQLIVGPAQAKSTCRPEGTKTASRLLLSGTKEVDFGLAILEVCLGSSLLFS